MLERVEGELDALEQILARKTVVMARELPSLKKTIITQEAEVPKRSVPAIERRAFCNQLHTFRLLSA